MAENKVKPSEKDSIENNISSGYISKSKVGNLPVSNKLEDTMKEKMEKTNEEIKKFKEKISEKYKFVDSIGVIPAQASKTVEEEYEIEEIDSKKGLIHILVLIPEAQFKNIKNIRLEMVKTAKEINDKFWIHVMTPVDIWNLGLDSKFDCFEALSMSFPVLDSNGLLSYMRVAQIHKSLVLKKFEKYVTSYVLGGSLTTGTTKKDSDVDTIVIIDDTDVKRMPRLELKEKLRGIIYSYIQEAEAMAGVKHILNVQIYLMTDFWEAVKDAHPVMFTFIRDGIPLYDRGAFLPWKSLLRMGKIKPSPEAIDMFMSSGDKLEGTVQKRVFDIATLDLFWGISTPTQGLLMLYGLAPPNVYETVKLFKEVFYEKEKLVEKKYVDILEEIMIKVWKGYEHGKLKPGDVSGKELDRLSKNAIDYIKKLKEIRTVIEKRVQEQSMEDTYNDLFNMLGSLLKKKSEAAILKEFEKTYITEGKLPPRYLENLKSIAKIKKDLSKKVPASKKKSTIARQKLEAEDARKFADEITKTLIEYNQRCDFLSMDRTRFIIKDSRDSKAEVFFLKNTFLVEGSKIQKIEGDNLINSNSEELKQQLLEHKSKESKIDSKSLDILKKAYGEFDLIY